MAASIPKNHNSLYFDTLCRTQKGETVLSFIHATHHAKKAKIDSGNIKKEIAARLEYAYRLFRDNLRGKDNGAGSYSGGIDQFDSQYTLGHEVGIWKNSNLDLSPLAQQVANNIITIREYLDIVFLNYFQPVNNKAIHMLYGVLKYLVGNDVDLVDKRILPTIYGVDIQSDDINSACYFLGATTYFKYNGNQLEYIGKYSKTELLSFCNIKYLGEEGYQKALNEINTDIKYVEYITSDTRKISEYIKQENNSLEKLLPEDIKHKYNRILVGAPGTGKSYKIEEQRVAFGKNYERVTFHPNYSYAQFVGTYKPKPKFRKNERGDNVEFVSYEFILGPFLRTWIKAQKNKEENFLLIVEEINRANAAAVFGDVFQLLDRKDNGTSEYNITTSEEMQDYLIDKESFDRSEVQTITIPSNMYIWATMNSADQGVYPMDAAFKRRWNTEYIGINEGRLKIATIEITLKLYGTIKWDMLRTKINEGLIEAGVNEDKLIGPFFLSYKELKSSSIDEIFKSKLLMYLFEDVLKHRKGKLFKPKFNIFSKVINAYNNNEEIFVFDVISSSLDEFSEEVILDLVSENSEEYSTENK